MNKFDKSRSRYDSNRSGRRNNNRGGGGDQFRNSRDNYGPKFSRVSDYDNNYSQQNSNRQNNGNNHDQGSSERRNNFNRNQGQSNFRGNNSFRGNERSNFSNNRSPRPFQRGGFNNRGGGGFNRGFGGSGGRNYPEDVPMPIVDNPQLEKVLHDAIITVLLNDDRAMPQSVLIAKTINEAKRHMRVFIERGEIVWMVEKMQRDFYIGKNVRDKYFVDYLDYPAVVNSEKTGEIRINAKGFGFINVEGETGFESAYYIHKKNLLNAIDGDTVRFVVLDTSSGPQKAGRDANGRDGKVVEIISHGKDTYVGEVKKNPTILEESQAFFVYCDNPRILSPIKILNPQNLVEGHKVVIKITHFNPGNLKGEVTKILGHKNDIGIDIESIVYDFGVEVQFPRAVEKEISEIDHSLTRFTSQSVRKDLTNISFVTIDPATSKDFDDAIYVQRETDHFLLYVAIADVASYIPFRSGLDEAAEDRGTSVYLINSVIPMLPLVLSNDLCSLNPNEKRCALVCEMKVDLFGVIDFDSATVYPALIKSHRRFSYDEVNQYFKKETSLETDEASVKTMLDQAYELFFLMQKTKESKGYVNFDLPEPKIIVDDKNVPVEIKLYERWHAQLMIENFMIAANEATTFYAEKNKIPFIYRVHDKPSIEALERFALQTKKLGFKITTKLEDIEPASIAKWLADNADNPYTNIIHMMLLRCMAKAVYSEQNHHHFGLASAHYTHFTSPIRRYPDVIVHRLLWMYLFTPELYTESERQMFKDRIAELALKSSQREVRAMEVERAVNNYKFAEYMAKFIGEEFEGMVTSVNRKGCFVRLENCVEGFASVMNSALDFFKLDEHEEALIGQKNNTKLTLATKVKVKVLATNPQLKSIDFEVVEIISNPY